MTTEFPSTKAAQATDLPEWDRVRYNVQKVSGKVDAVDTGFETTKGGTQIAFYQIHIDNPRNVEALSPVTGPVVLRQDMPRTLKFRQDQQGYYYLTTSAGVDNIGELVGKDLTLVLQDKPWKNKEGFDRHEYYYVVAEGTGSVSTGPTSSNGSTALTEADRAILRELLTGATVGQFNMAALKDERVKGNKAVQLAVTSGSFLKETDLVADENGVYGVVATG